MKWVGILVALLAIAGIAAAMPMYGHVVRVESHGTFEHTVHIETPSGKLIEVNIEHDRIVEDNTVVIVHNVQVTIEGNTIKLKGTHGECELNATPEMVRERIREQLRAQVREMNIEEAQVMVKEGNMYRYVWKPVYKVKVQKRARFLGIIPMDVEYDVTVDPETGEIISKGPWWLVFFVG